MDREFSECGSCGKLVEIFFSEQGSRDVWYDCGDCGEYKISRKMHRDHKPAVKEFFAVNRTLADWIFADAKSKGRRPYFKDGLFKPYL